MSSWLGPTLFFALFAAVFCWRLPLHHDLAAHLDAIHHMRIGERLYTDLLEPNPPLVFYLYYPPALFAHGTGLPAIASLQGYIVLLTGFALYLCHRVMRAVQRPARRADQQAALWSLLLALAFIRLPDAGQREHWAFAFSCPYLLAAGAQIEGRALRGAIAWMVGLLAGIAFSIKPHFAAVPLLVEGYLFARGRRSAWRRLECRVAIAFGLAYASWVIAGTDYLRVARIAASLYSAYGSGFWTVFASSSPALWGLAILVVALFRFERGVQPFVCVAALASIGFLGCGLVQGKGWPYHWHPVAAGSALILALFGWSILCAGGERPLSRVPPARRPLLFASLAALPMVATAALLWPSWESAQAQKMRALADVVRNHAGGRPVAWFTTDAVPMFPTLSYAGAWSALPVLWPIPGLYRDAAVGADPFPYHAPDAMDPVERDIVAEIERAFVRGDPALLVFDRRATKQGFGRTTFDFETYLQGVPALASQMQRYEPLGEVGSWRFYQRRADQTE